MEHLVGRDADLGRGRRHAEEAEVAALPEPLERLLDGRRVPGAVDDVVETLVLQVVHGLGHDGARLVGRHRLVAELEHVDALAALGGRLGDHALPVAVQVEDARVQDADDAGADDEHPRVVRDDADPVTAVLDGGERLHQTGQV